MRRVEHFFETLLFQSRWLLGPFYLGLVISLVLLLIHFVVQLTTFVLKIHIASESEVILGVLALIDLVLVGNLVLIVIFSGYENFVSRMDIESHDRPEWMTKVDFGGLKQKLMSSIVAISAIQVLKAFMNLDNYDQTKLFTLAGIHVVFLGSMLIVALSDRLSEKTKPPEEHAPAKRRQMAKDAKK